MPESRPDLGELESLYFQWQSADGRDLGTLRDIQEFVVLRIKDATARGRAVDVLVRWLRAMGPGDLEGPKRQSEVRAHQRGCLLDLVVAGTVSGSLLLLTAGRGWWALLFGTAGAGATTLIWFGDRHPITRARRSRSCPECGYSLTGSPDAISTELLGGVVLGPEWCPECGRPWPLVP
ncbi:MAG: hypothetical protein DHS20C14_20490 [Phycisphaeraceae bacterium]|nr:MAG: hypothetical protein DHS20C14_20490 [Phycisphaeraceae bacterium]